MAGSNTALYHAAAHGVICRGPHSPALDAQDATNRGPFRAPRSGPHKRHFRY
jgi:hypothetical protein